MRTRIGIHQENQQATNTDATRMSFFAVTDPALITVDMEKLNQHQKELNEKRAAQPVRNTEGPAEELQRLRKELFNLTERAKSTEIYANNKAGEVKLVEEYLNDARSKKKAAFESGNARAEQSCTHTVMRLQAEFVDASNEFKRAQRVAAQADRALKEWPHHERLEVLAKSLASENDHKSTEHQPRR